MSLFGAIGNYFKNAGLALFGQLKETIVKFLTDFVKDDLGALAKDAVIFVEAELPGATSVDKIAAAKAKFIVDAKAAGHDAEAFGESMLNFLMEAALQAFLLEANAEVAKL